MLDEWDLPAWLLHEYTDIVRTCSHEPTRKKAVVVLFMAYARHKQYHTHASLFNINKKPVISNRSEDSFHFGSNFGNILCLEKWQFIYWTMAYGPESTRKVISTVTWMAAYRIVIEFEIHSQTGSLHLKHVRYLLLNIRRQRQHIKQQRKMEWRSMNFSCCCVACCLFCTITARKMAQRIFRNE